MAINRYEKEEKKNKQDAAKKIPKPVGRAPIQYVNVSKEKAKQAYDNGLTLATRKGNGSYNYHQKDGKPAISKYYLKKNAEQDAKPVRYSYSGHKELSDFKNVAEYTAYLRNSGATQEEYQLLADAIQNPSSAFYNPYWKGRSTQTAAMDFFRSYFGTDDIRFDQQFFDDNIGLRQFTKRSDLTHNLSQPTQKDSEDVWAAYFYESLLADKEYSDNATAQWNQLRSDAATFYNDYQTIHGRKPTMEEFLDSIDITDYSVLYSMDASRNIGSDKSSKVVQLNSGCNYSNEGLVGLYSVLSSGGDISEDRDYFEDAVQYYMQPYEEAAARKTMLAAMGFDTSGWSEEDYAREMQKARKAGDSATYEALKQDRWQNGEHMDSVDTTDYLGERFGYNKDAKYFSDIRSVYQPIWNEMYTDSSRSSIKKPNSSDSEVYHAAYQAWQECQGEELLNKVEDQAEAFLGLIDAIDTSRWDTQKEFEDYYNKAIAPALESEEYSDLRRYMAGDISLVRDVFISEDEIKEYVQRHWNGDAPETAAPENEPETVVMDPEETPLLYEFQQSQNAANDAAKRSSDATKIGQALLGLSESGSSISSAMLAEKGISVFWGDAVENGEIKNTLIALWRNLKADGYVEKLGDEATFGQKMSIDPVLKMVAEDVDLEAYNHHQLTMDGLYDLIEQQTTSQMSGSDITVADGVIAAAIPDANELFSGIERGRNRFGQNNTILSKSEFDLATYNDVYSRCRSRDFSPEDSADIAIDAAIFGNSGLKAMSAGLESDAELTSAANSVVSKVTAEEGYPEAVAVVGPVIAEVVASEDDEILAAEAKDLGASVLLGMSQEASPLHSAATKNFLFEVLRGDISTEDIVAGIKNSAKGLVSFGKQISEGIGAYGDELRILGYSNGIITTEKYDALDDESRVIADEFYNQSIGDIAGGGEIINGIIARAAVNGHDDIYGTDKNKVVDTAGEKVMANDALFSWLGTITSLSSETTQEQYKVGQDLRNYGKWLTYDEASALMSAWQQGYITYDDFNSIIMDRVSLYSNSYVNGMKNIDQISDSIQIARDGLDDLEAGINHNLEIAESGYSEGVVAEADSALQQIATGNDPVMLARSNGLAETIGLDAMIEQYGDDEGALFVAIDDALRGIVEGNTAANVMDDTSGYDFTLPQVDELRKVVDLYEQFGAYGYEFISSATPEFLENFDIDLAGVGLEGSVADYMDKLTGSKWRDAYRNKGIGVIDTIGTGGLIAFQQMGNIWVGGKRIINDVLEFLPGITAYQKGDGSYYDRNQSMNSKVGETLETQATGFEKFASGIISETVRNQTTGFIGAALGNMKSAGDFARYMGKAVSSVPSMNTVANVGGTAQLAASVLKADRLIDSTTILSRLPFVSSVFTGAYSENRDQGKGVFRSIIRASTDTMIELFTETSAVDDKLNAAKNWILPNLDAVDNGMFEYILKTGSDAFNEIGQEELSLVAGKVFDMIESFEGENVTGVSSFFHEMWDTIQRETEGIGAEAASTAVSTFFVTLLGSVWNIPGSLTKIKLNEYRMNDSVLTQQGFEEMCEDAAFELMEAYNGGEQTQEAPKTEAKDKGMPAFDRTKGAVYGAAKDMLMGKGAEQDVAQAIEDTMSNPAPSVEQPAEEQAPEQAEEPVEAEYQPDPNLSAGSNKVAAYINEAEAGKRDAVAAEVGRNVVAEFLENDGTIKAAEKVVETAQAVYNKAMAAANEIQGRITENKQRLQMIFAAAADEGRDFNSPDVQNAVVANQQATSALESDYAESAKAAEEAAEAVTKAENDLKETRDEAEKMAAAEAKKKEDEARISYDEAKKILRKSGRPSEEDVYVRGHGQDVKGTAAEYQTPEEMEEKETSINYGRMETGEEESEKDKWHRQGDDAVRESLDNPLDFTSQFENLTMSLGRLFEHIADVSEKNQQLFRQQVTKDQYDALFGIFKRIKGSEAYIDTFFRHEKNSENNADIRYIENNHKTTIEDVKALTSADYKALMEDFGITPRGETEDEIFLEMPVKVGGYKYSEDAKRRKEESDQYDEPEPKSEDVIAAEHAYESAMRERLALEQYAEELRVKCVEMVKAKATENIGAIHAERKKVADQIDAITEKISEAWLNLREANKKEKGIYSNRFVSFLKSDVKDKLDRIRNYSALVKENADRDLHALKKSGMSVEELREEYIRIAKLDQLSEENARIVRNNINQMGIGMLYEEIYGTWLETGNAEYTDGFFEMPVHKEFRTASEMKKYVESLGGWKSDGGTVENYEVQQSYFVSLPVLSLLKQYENQLSKDPENRSAFGTAAAALDASSTEEFVRKLIEASSSYRTEKREGIHKTAFDILTNTKVSSVEPDKRYYAVDTNDTGTLRIYEKCKNTPLSMYSGAYNASLAKQQIQKAYEMIANGNEDYTMRVVMENGKNAVSRMLGGYYSDLKNVYLPSLDYILKNAKEVYVRHEAVSKSGKQYDALDFSFEFNTQVTTEALKSVLNEAESFFSALFRRQSNQPSDAEFGLYAESYLRARADVLNREIYETSREYRLNGDKYGQEHTIQLGEEIKAKKEELAQIRTALNSDEGLQEFISGYRFGGTGANREELQAVMEDMAEKVDHNSPEMQAAIELLENTPEQEEAVEAPETADSSAKREIAAKVDKTLTEGMSPEERATYYAERANDAMLAGDTQRYEQYNREVANAAEEAGYETERVEASSEVTDTPEEAKAPVVPNYRVDENTLLEGDAFDEDSFQYGEYVVQTQDDLKRRHNEEIEGLAEQERVLLKSGAQKYKDRDAKLKELFEAQKTKQKGTVGRTHVDSEISKLFAEHKADSSGKDAAAKYDQLHKKKADVVRKRDLVKENLRKNSTRVMGSKYALDVYKGISRYSATAPIKGTVGDLVPRQFAIKLTENLHKIRKPVYGNITVYNLREIADAMKPLFKHSDFTRWNDLAKTIGSAASNLERYNAELMYENTAIAKRMGSESLDMDKAKNEFAEVYASQVPLRSGQAIDRAEQKSKMQEARNTALEKAKAIDERVAAMTEDEMQRRSNALGNITSGEIPFNSTAIDRMKAESRMLYAMGNGDIYGILTGKYGGNLPVPIANGLLGFTLIATEGNKGQVRKNLLTILGNMDISDSDLEIVMDYFNNDRTYEWLKEKLPYEENDPEAYEKSDYKRIHDIIELASEKNSGVLKKFYNPMKGLQRIMASPERVVDDFYGEYAPIINAIFVHPVLEADNIIATERDRMLKRIDKYVPNKKISVSVDGQTQRLKYSEIAYRIIDERAWDKEHGDDYDYVTYRLDSFGIKDENIRDTIRNAVFHLRDHNDYMLQLKNETQKRNGLKLTAPRGNGWYMHHYSPEGGLSEKIGLYMKEEEIPSYMFGRTESNKPIKQFNASDLERKGNDTGRDAKQSIKRVITADLNSIYQTDNTIRLRQFAEAHRGNYKLDDSGNIVYEGEGEAVHPVFETTTFSVDQNGKLTKSRASAFQLFFDEIANKAANKKDGIIDRGIEKKVGRKGFMITRAAATLNSLNKVGFSVKSALTNTLPVLRSFAEHPVETVSAIRDTVKLFDKNAEKDYVAQNSKFVSARASYAPEEAAIIPKISDAAYWMSEQVDKFATNVIVRANLYYEMDKNGLDAQTALMQAEDKARRSMTTKTRAARAAFYDDSVLGIVGQFTQEAVNDIFYNFKDLPKYSGGIPEYIAKLIGTFVLYTLYNYATVSETAPDVIGSVKKSIDAAGEEDNAVTVAIDVLENTMKALFPFEGILEEGAAGIPIVQTVSDLYGSAKEAISDGDFADFGLEVLANTLPGGIQARRTITGMKDMSRGYAMNSAGNVKYGLDKSNPLSWVQSALFGSGGTYDALEYANSGYKALGESISNTYKELRAAGLDHALAWSASKGTKAAQKATNDAENIATVAGVTEEKVAESEEAAHQSRKETGMPGDIASWGATAFSEEGNNAVKTGVQAWIDYGVATYPKEITTSTFDIDGEPYLRPDGVGYPLDDEDYAAINALYKEKYEQTVKLHGRINSPEAAKELEKALNKIRTEARNEYMQKGYFERERGEE